MVSGFSHGQRLRRQQGVVSQDSGEMTIPEDSQSCFPRQRMTKSEVPGQTELWPRSGGPREARKRCGGSIDVTNNGVGPFTDLCVWMVTGRDLSPTGFHLVLLSSCPLYPSTHTAKLPLTSFNRPSPKPAPTFNSPSVPTASGRVFRIVLPI